MAKERPQIEPNKISEALKGARTFIGTGSTFADNFRFAGTALAKLAIVENKEERNTKVRILYANLIEETADDDLYDLFGIGMTEVAYLKRLMRQMDEEELSTFIESNTQNLAMLNLEEEAWAEMARNHASESAIRYNKTLEAIATALLGMNVSPF